MNVKAIMIPFEELNCLSMDNTVQEALEMIDKNKLLSLPVIEGRKFAGVLSKQFIFETYFRNDDVSKEKFCQKKVREFIQTKVPTIGIDLPIEQAAAIFITSKIRFIPITSKDNELLGIVTHQAIFKEYQKIFGQDYQTVRIYTHDGKGTLARITDVISKSGGNIKNTVQIDTEVMGLQEVFLRVDCNDFGRVVRSLKKNGFDVRES